MNINPTGIIVGVICLVVAIMIASTITWDVQVVEEYLANQPYSYQQSLIHQKQITKYLFFKSTQVQYIIQNTESVNGDFTLNFIFDNGEKAKTISKKVEILAGEKTAITISAPISIGISSVTLNVIPPTKAILEKRTVTKKVNIFDYVGIHQLLNVILK